MPRKSIVNELQTEESSVNSPVRRSTRMTNGPGPAGIAVRRTSQTTESDGPAKATRARRTSTQAPEEKVEPKITRRRASILEEDSQKQPTPSRRGRKPSVTTEAIDESDKPKPVKGRRTSITNNEQDAPVLDEDLQKQPNTPARRGRKPSVTTEPIEVSENSKPVRGRRTSTANNEKDVEEKLKTSAPVRSRRSSAASHEPETELKVAPKTPARATRRRSSAAERPLVEEISTASKRTTRGRKGSNADEIIEETKIIAPKARRKSVNLDEGAIIEESIKPSPRRGRRLSTDNPVTTTISKTPGRSTRRFLINSEEESKDILHENKEISTEIRSENELSPISLKESLTVKVTPLKNRKIVEKVESELDLSIINESVDDINTSSKEDSFKKYSKSASRLSTDLSLNVDKEKRKSVSSELQLSNATSTVNITKSSPTAVKRLSVGLENEASPRKSPRLLEKSRNDTQKNSTAIPYSPRESPINKTSNSTPQRELYPQNHSKDTPKLVDQKAHASYVSSGSDSSFRFHLSTVSLAESGEIRENTEDILNISKESNGSNKENISIYDPASDIKSLEKSFEIQLQEPILARVSEVLKIQQNESSFVEPMEVDESIVNNDGSMSNKSIALDESSVVFNKRHPLEVGYSESSENEELSLKEKNVPQVPDHNILSKPIKYSVKQSCTETDGSDIIIEETEEAVDISVKPSKSSGPTNTSLLINDLVDKVKIALARKSSSPINRRRSAKKSKTPVPKNDSTDSENEDHNRLHIPKPNRRLKSETPSPLKGHRKSNLKSKSPSPLKGHRKYNSKSKSPSPRRMSVIKKDDAEQVKESLNSSNIVSSQENAFEELNRSKTPYNESILTGNRAARSRSRSPLPQREMKINPVSRKQSFEAPKGSEEIIISNEKIILDMSQTSQNLESESEDSDSIVKTTMNTIQEDPVIQDRTEYHTAVASTNDDTEFVSILTTDNEISHSGIKHSESAHYDFDLPSDDDDLNDSKKSAYKASENSINVHTSFNIAKQNTTLDRISNTDKKLNKTVSGCDELESEDDVFVEKCDIPAILKQEQKETISENPEVSRLKEIEVVRSIDEQFGETSNETKKEHKENEQNQNIDAESETNKIHALEVENSHKSCFESANENENNQTVDKKNKSGHILCELETSTDEFNSRKPNNIKDQIKSCEINAAYSADVHDSDSKNDNCVSDISARFSKSRTSLIKDNPNYEPYTNEDSTNISNQSPNASICKNQRSQNTEDLKKNTSCESVLVINKSSNKLVSEDDPMGEDENDELIHTGHNKLPNAEPQEETINDESNIIDSQNKSCEISIECTNEIEDGHSMTKSYVKNTAFGISLSFSEPSESLIKDNLKLELTSDKDARIVDTSGNAEVFEETETMSTKKLNNIVESEVNRSMEQSEDQIASTQHNEINVKSGITDVMDRSNQTKEPLEENEDTVNKSFTGISQKTGHSKLTPKETNMKRNRPRSLDDFAAAKLADYLKSKAKEVEESSTDDEEEVDDESEQSEKEYIEFIDGMVEEGEEDTPSEDSNEIIDEGESIGYSDSNDFGSEGEYDEDDSFICDEEDSELLSGEEYDLGNEKKQTKSKKSRIIDTSELGDDDIIKPKKKEKQKPKKKSRIIRVSDSSSDEANNLRVDDEPELLVASETNNKHIDDSLILIGSEDKDNKTQTNLSLRDNRKGDLGNQQSGISNITDEVIIEDSYANKEPEVLDTSKPKDQLLDDSVIFINEIESKTSNKIETNLSQRDPGNQQLEISNITNELIFDSNAEQIANNESDIAMSEVKPFVQKRNRKSLTIQESIIVDGVKDPMVTKRINSLVESFCSNVKKGEIALNLSLELEDPSSTPKETEKTESVHVLSSIKICPGNISNTEKDNSKIKRILSESSEQGQDLRDVNNKKLKRRLSKSLTEIHEEDKKAKRQKKNKKNKASSEEKLDQGNIKYNENRMLRPDLTEDLKMASFGLMNQLITDVKNRPRRVPRPTSSLDSDLNSSWVTTKAKHLKPSTSAISNTKKIEVPKLHPKDFKNQLLSDTRRVKRVDTKTLLKKKGVFL